MLTVQWQAATTETADWGQITKWLINDVIMFRILFLTFRVQTVYTTANIILNNCSDMTVTQSVVSVPFTE